MKTEESRRVLDLLAEGKITVSEAEQLLQALNAAPKAEPASNASAGSTVHGDKPKRKYMCIKVEPSHGAGGELRGPRNIRLPLEFLRSGIKLAGVMPGMMPGIQNHIAERMREKGIDIDVGRMKPEQVDEFITQLSELNLDFDSDRGHVRIYCE